MGSYTQSCQSVVDKLASVGALYQPNNAFYSAISANNQASQPLLQPHRSESKQSSSEDDYNLLYQQLKYCMVSLLTLAKQAGRAGAAMTEQQQAVLHRQLSMIEGIIEQYAKSSFEKDLSQDVN